MKSKSHEYIESLLELHDHPEISIYFFLKIGDGYVIEAMGHGSYIESY